MTSSEQHLPPLVTIGIPTYNRRTSLERALGSAQAQTYPNLEIVVSDNASTDDTAAFLQAAAAEDPRIDVLLQAANCGPTANFDAVLRASTGAFFLWLADDDHIDARYVEACVDSLRADARRALVSGTASYHRAGAFERLERPMNIDSPDPVARIIAYCRRVNRNEIFYGVARTEDWRRFSPLRNRIAEDWSMVAGLASRGTLVTLPDVQLHRRVEGYGVAASARSLDQGWWRPHAARFLSVANVTGDILRHASFDHLSMPQRRRAALGAGVRLTVTAIRSTLLSTGAAALGDERWELLRRRTGRTSSGLPD